MVNDLLLITWASCISGTMPLYMEQLNKAGIPVWIEDISNAPYLNRGMFISEKIRLMRDLVERNQHYEQLVFTDAHDVTFYGSKESILLRMPKEGVLQAAEKNCYPDGSLADLIPNRGPWRFANGGMECGSPEAFLKWFEDAEASRHYHSGEFDQHFMNRLLAARDPLCTIDWETRMFFCLFGGYEELWWDNGYPVNMAYDTRPVFVHANGKWDATKALQNQRMSII